MIWKRKKKETSNGGGRIRTGIYTKLEPYHWATETNFTYVYYKICIYIQYGVSDHMTFDLCNPTIPILIKKNLIKCIIKVVNVSKSQYYEFRHNIMNLGNQNSKYSWRIRDLENPQTGTQFANSVLMYKIIIITYLYSAQNGCLWALYKQNIQNNILKIHHIPSKVFYNTLKYK